MPVLAIVLAVRAWVAWSPYGPGMKSQLHSSHACHHPWAPLKVHNTTQKNLHQRPPHQSRRLRPPYSNACTQRRPSLPAHSWARPQFWRRNHRVVASAGRVCCHRRNWSGTILTIFTCLNIFLRSLRSLSFFLSLFWTLPSALLPFRTVCPKLHLGFFSKTLLRCSLVLCSLFFCISAAWSFFPNLCSLSKSSYAVAVHTSLRALAPNFIHGGHRKRWVRYGLQVQHVGLPLYYGFVHYLQGHPRKSLLCCRP